MDDSQKIADLTETIRLDPDNVKAYGNRGIAYANKKEYDRAIADFNTAIRLNPKGATAYGNRGVAYANKGDYDRAITDLTTAIRLNPDNTTAYYFRGIAYANNRDDEPAIADFTEAVRLNPNNSASVTALAKAKDAAQKAAELEEALRRKANDAAHIERGQEFFIKQDYDQAISEFNKAIRIDPNNANVYHFRSVAYANKKEYDRAIADLTEAVRLDPNSDTSTSALAKAKATAQKAAELEAAKVIAEAAAKAVAKDAALAATEQTADELRDSDNGAESDDEADFYQKTDGRARTSSAKGNSMINFVKSAFRGFFGVILWLNLILCLIAGGIVGNERLHVGGAIVGVLVGLLAGLFINIVFGGFIAIILNIDENLEYLTNKTKNASSSNVSSRIKTQKNKQCKQCGKSVDSGYTACPHCGASNFE
jgi:tetratricopeptide (TPR) repeat protein